MPIGSFSTLREVVGSLLSTNPKSVLDLGIGHGINGAAVRNWLDHGVQPYSIQLEGVEGFDYYSPLWLCYNHVHRCTIQEFFENDDRKWDYILMTDVIEHFAKLEGLTVIQKCRERLTEKGVLMIVTPAVWIEQGAYMGNELEVHQSLWTAKDFENLGFGVLNDGAPDSWGYKMIVAEYVSR